MVDFIDGLLHHPFLQRALLAGILASIGCGLVGPFVVAKRISYLAGGIAHAVLGGMGIAYYLGFPPIRGALVAAVVAALLIGGIVLKRRQYEDTLIGTVWAVGMAIGVLFIAKTPGYNVDLMSYLFGNILLVSQSDLYIMVGVDLTIALVFSLFYKQFLAVAFDEEFARTRGVRVGLFYLLLLVMVALTVVLLIRVVGLILTIALLTLPAAIARHFVDTLFGIIGLAIPLGVLFTCSGLGVSYTSDLPAGAIITLVTGGVYALSTLGIGMLRRLRPS